MKLEKFLQQWAEKDAESLITESDREFSMQLAIRAQQSAPQPAPKRKRFKFAAIASTAAACCLVAVVLGITLPLTLNRQPAFNGVLYKEDDILQTSCTIDDVNSNSENFKIEEAEDITIHPQLNYDSVSGDKLYYSVRVITEISVFTLNIVINENYNYDFNIVGDLLTEPLSLYNIEYNKKSVDGLMATEIIYKGCIKVESETVYIDYTQNFEIDDQAFFDDIQNVLKVKN